MRQGLIYLSVAIFFSSCSIVGALVGDAIDPTHKDFMNKVETRQQAYRIWGMPSNSYRDGNTEWLRYNLGSNTRGGFVGSTYIENTSSRYIELQLRGDDVIYWRTGGVDYGRKSMENFLCVVGLIIDFLILDGAGVFD